MGQGNTNEVSPPTPQPSSSYRTKRLLWLWPTLIVSIIALSLACGSWIGQSIRSHDQQTELARQMVLIDTMSGHLSTLQQNLLQVDQKIQARIKLLEANQAELRNQEAVLNSLYETLAHFDAQRSLTEVESMLTFAHQQLQLSGNPAFVIPILVSAERRLKQPHRPEFIALRQAIMEDIHRLEVTPYMNLVEIASKINQVVLAINTLSLPTSTRSTAPLTLTRTDTHWFNRLLNQIWSEIKQLIQIQRIDAAETIMLESHQAFLLRENIKLQLMSSRSAILMRDTAGFYSGLSSAKEYIMRYYDVHETKTSNVLNRLEALREEKIDTPLPDFSNSLSILQNIYTSEKEKS